MQKKSFEYTLRKFGANSGGTSGTDGTNGTNETDEMTENEDDCELEQRFQSRRGCKCSQLHPNAFLTTSTTTITLLQDSNQHGNALAPCLRVILDSEALRWVQAGHPRYTGARRGRPWVAHTRRLPTDDKNDTDKRQDKRAFSETGVDCTGQVLHLESCLVAGSEVAHPDHQSLIAWHY